MDIKQVFLSYDFEGTTGIRGLKYCPMCGTKCDVGEFGGRQRPYCPSCGFVHYRNPFPGASVLVMDGDRVLLGRRGRDSFQGGKWCLPCGFIEYDEDFLTAAVREVKEETGLDIELQSIVNVVSNYLGPNAHTLVIVLVAQPVGGKLKANDDLEELGWFAPGDRLPELAFEADRHIIERYWKTRPQGLGVDKEYIRGK